MHSRNNLMSCPHSLSPIRLRDRRRPGLAKAVRRFVRSSGDLEVSLRVQASERSVESDSVEVVCEGAMQRFNFTRSLQSSSQQPWNSYRHVQFLRSTHPLSSGYFGGTIWRSMLWPRTRFRRRSGPPSPWTECPQEPCPRARVRSSRSRSGVLGSRSTSPRDLRLRTSRASSRTASPERLPLPSVKERAIRLDHANRATTESKPGSALYPHLVNTSA